MSAIKQLAVGKVTLPPVVVGHRDEAETVWAAVRKAHGLHPDGRIPVISDQGSNLKMAKSDKDGLRYSVGVTLAPANEAGFGTLCPFSTPECRKLCLRSAGKMGMSHAVRAQHARTQLLAQDPAAFVALLVRDLDKAQAKADAQGATLAVRLNVLSDIPWERVAPWLFARYPRAQFYDYTKHPDRFDLPANYHLTLSASERTTTDDVWLATHAGDNVTVVVDVKRGQPLPDMWAGLPAIDGDQSDYRAYDPKGVVVLLRAKGLARKGPVGLDHFVKPLV